MAHELNPELSRKLPRGEWQLLLKLEDYRRISFSSEAAKMFAEQMDWKPRIATPPRGVIKDGMMYANLHMREVGGQALIDEGAQILHAAMSYLAIDAAVEACVIPQADYRQAIGVIPSCFQRRGRVEVSTDINAALHELTLPPEARSAALDAELAQLLAPPK